MRASIIVSTLALLLICRVSPAMADSGPGDEQRPPVAGEGGGHHEPAPAAHNNGPGNNGPAPGHGAPQHQNDPRPAPAPVHHELDPSPITIGPDGNLQIHLNLDMQGETIHPLGCVIIYLAPGKCIAMHSGAL